MTGTSTRAVEPAPSANSRIVGAEACAAYGEQRFGKLVLRLAATDEEIDAALALRYRVFYDEMNAIASPETAAARRDRDSFDDACDHLLVIDESVGMGADGVVGTYRLLRRVHAEVHGRFYTADEYDIGCLVDYPGEMVELGRSCVDEHYRNRPTMQALWRGIAHYVFTFDATLMFGCASLPGIDPEQLKVPLSYLYHYHLAPPAMRPVALPGRYTDMNFMPAAEVDKKAAMAALPPLVKGYIRLGVSIGDGAVIDEQFNTTDVCIIVDTDWVTDKYYKHYHLPRLDMPWVGERDG